MKITKKEYINGLAHDIEFLSQELHTGLPLIWWHGTTYTRPQVKAMKKELEEDQAKIQSDKSYRPWND